MVRQVVANVIKCLSAGRESTAMPPGHLILKRPRFLCNLEIWWEPSPLRNVHLVTLPDMLHQGPKRSRRPCLLAPCSILCI